MISKERLRHFLVAERAAYGTTLLLTTHDMSDIERLCERVLVDHGRLVFDGTLVALAERVALQRVLVVDLPGPHPDLAVAQAAMPVASSTASVSDSPSAPETPRRRAFWLKSPRRWRSLT